MGLIVHIHEKLRLLDDRGSRLLNDGTWLVRKNPERDDGLFTDSYLHELYAGLGEADVCELERLIAGTLPSALASFYREANGLSLFAKSLSIRGLRKNYSRTSENRLPVSLEYGNVIERPKNDERSQVRFGWYPIGKAELVIYRDQPDKVFAVPRYSAGPVLFEWVSFEEFLLTEVDRLIGLYQERQGAVNFLEPLPPPWL